MNDWEYLLQVFIAMAMAVALGGLIGLERELKGRWAGLRTHIMVAVGACMFALVGVSAAKTAPSELTRVIQGIATGVGFIGAGTIIKLTDRMEVRGLTTASSIWLAAAVGTACGVGRYELAVIGAIMAMIVLTVLRRADRVLEKRHDDGNKSGPDEKSNQ